MVGDALDQIAPSYGQRYQWLNGGQFTNQGIELSLTGTPMVWMPVMTGA